MTVKTKPADSSTALTITQTGEPWAPKDLEVLEAYPEAKFNVLVPTQSVRQVNPYLVPDIQTVQLRAIEGSRDVYHDSQMKGGHYAPTASALRKIADTAGINEIESKRTDDGRNPDVVEWTVVIERQLPTGQTVRGHGTKRVDLTSMSFASEAHKKRTRQFMLENAQTKALNRAIRSLLSLHGSYPLSELAKPFAVLRWVPNMAHPDVQKAFLGQLAGSTGALFGPTDQPKQLATEPADVVVAPEAAEDDPAPEQTATDDAVDFGAAPATADEPAWANAAAPDGTPKIVVTLRERADAAGGAAEPDTATAEQRARLKDLFTPIGGADMRAVLTGALSIDNPALISEAQADAILDQAEASKTFVPEWKAAADWFRSQAGHE